MFDIKEQLKKLPGEPGVYLMKDENGEYLTTKKEHKGLGIQSMKHVAKKYKGDIAIEQKDGIFNMTIVFPDHDLILDENNPILDNVR